MNIMITFLSLYNPRNNEKEYSCPEKELNTVKGIQTADAPTRYLLLKTNKLNEAGIQKIICIASEKVVSERIETQNNKTGLEIYKEMIERECEEKKYIKPEFIVVPYDYEIMDIESGQMEMIQNIGSRMNQVYNQLIKNLNYTDKVYIDYTGGFRDTSFFMTVILRYLEYEGIDCEEVIYSNFQEERIVSIRYIYNLFQLINGMEEFIDNGNNRILNEFYENNKNLQQFPNLESLLREMKRFSDSMSICQVGEINQIMESIINRIKKIESADEVINDLEINMFKSMLGVIKKKFYIEEGEEEKLSYTKLLKWSAENNMLQQALTLYVEKMPEEYFNRNLLFKEVLETVRENMKLKKRPGNSDATQLFYDVLYDYFQLDEEFEEFSKILSEAQYIEINSSLLIKYSGKNKKIKDALKRVSDFIRKEYGNNKTRNIVKPKKYGYTFEAKNISTCLNKLKTDKKIRASFFYEVSKSDYEKMSLNTYQKKIEAIRKLSSEKSRRISKLSVEELKKMLEYYFVFKILRNQINHANEEKDAVTLEMVTEYFKTKNVSLVLSADNIRKILKEAIVYNEKINEKYFDKNH